MAEAYPVELRERAVATYESGEGSYASVANTFALGEATVKRWVWLARKHGSLVPQPKAGGNHSTIAEADIEKLLGALGDATAGELTAELNRKRARAEHVHVSSMKRALHRCGYVVKKNAAGRWKLSDQTSSRNEKRSRGRSTPSR